MSERNKSIKLTIDKIDPSAPPERKSTQTGHIFFKRDFGLLDYINDVIFIIDAAGRFKFINKASQERTGLPSDALIGLSYLDLMEPRYCDFARNSFETAINGEVGPAFEMEWQGSTGQKITVEANWTTLYDDSTAVGVLGALRDVTDRKNAQEALAKARDEMELRVNACS